MGIFSIRTWSEAGSQYLRTHPGNTNVFRKRTSDYKTITPSTRNAGKWQVTHWDAHGAVSDYCESDLIKAIGEVLLAGYQPITREEFDAIEFLELVPM